MPFFIFKLQLTPSEYLCVHIHLMATAHQRSKEKKKRKMQISSHFWANLKQYKNIVEIRLLFGLCHPIIKKTFYLCRRPEHLKYSQTPLQVHPAAIY